MIGQSLQKQSYASIQCRNKEIYKQLFDYFITESNICTFIEGDHVNYIENKTYNTLTIFQPEEDSKKY